MKLSEVKFAPPLDVKLEPFPEYRPYLKGHNFQRGRKAIMMGEAKKLLFTERASQALKPFANLILEKDLSAMVSAVVEAMRWAQSR